MAGLKQFEDELSKLYDSSPFQPEAQIAAFRKSLALSKLKEEGTYSVNHHAAIVDIINSLGIQFRSDNFEYDLYRKDCGKDSMPYDNKHLKEIPDWSGLLTVLQQLPKEWSVVQISKGPQPAELLRQVSELNEGDPTLIVTRLPCGEDVTRIKPFSLIIPPSGISTGTNIFGRIQEIHQSQLKRSVNKKAREDKKQSSVLLQNCVLEVENYWLRGWKCLLSGNLKNPSKMEKLQLGIRELMKDGLKYNNFYSPEQVEYMLCLLALNYDHLKEREMYQVLSKLLLECDVSLISDFINKLKSLNRDQNLHNSSKHPLILILDNSLEIIPWEMCVPLLEHPVSRVSSLHVLYALFKRHEKFISNGYRSISVDSVFSVINPSEDLKDCEKQMGGFIGNNIPWCESVIGKKPTSKDFLQKIMSCSFYIYCGHGSGMSLLAKEEILDANIAGVLLLFGCSSNRLRNVGDGCRAPFCNSLVSLILTGCPCIVGNLYNVDSKDVDNATIAMLSAILPAVDSSHNQKKFVIKQPLEPNLLQAIHIGRKACQKYWTKACLMARGLPVRIELTEESKRKICEKIKST